jgi:hypothetical protein
MDNMEKPACSQIIGILSQRTDARAERGVEILNDLAICIAPKKATVNHIAAIKV